MGKHVEEGFDEWAYMYNTNFMTTLNCCKKILPHMKKNNYGHIINIGAKAAIQGLPLAGAYTTSKSSVHMLTKTIALENTHIKCNAILPGILNTSKNKKNMPKTNKNTWTKIKNVALEIETIISKNKTGNLLSI